MYADDANLLKLYMIFPHIVEAHRMKDWLVAPVTDHYIVENNDHHKTEIKIEHDTMADGNDKKIMTEGCFLWYLFYSGHFLSSMARAVIYADNNNLDMINKEFPGMIVAYRLSDWYSLPQAAQ
jgi:hypothetical protein